MTTFKLLVFFDFHSQTVMRTVVLQIFIKIHFANFVYCLIIESAKRASSPYRDLRMTLSESVVFWVEYSIWHGMEADISPSSASAGGFWTSHFMLDMCAALVTTLLMIWFVTRAVLHVAFNKYIPSNVKWRTIAQNRVHNGVGKRVIVK